MIKGVTFSLLTKNTDMFNKTSKNILFFIKEVYL